MRCLSPRTASWIGARCLRPSAASSSGASRLTRWRRSCSSFGARCSERPLPAFFVPCGTADPLLDDSRRLATALRTRGAKVQEAYYPGGVHAFQAFVWQARAKQAWQDVYAFLDRTIGQAA